jgi:hypothetical protein
VAVNDWLVRRRVRSAGRLRALISAHSTELVAISDGRLHPYGTCAAYVRYVGTLRYLWLSEAVAIGGTASCGARRSYSVCAHTVYTLVASLSAFHPRFLVLSACSLFPLIALLCFSTFSNSHRALIALADMYGDPTSDFELDPQYIQDSHAASNAANTAIPSDTHAHLLLAHGSHAHTYAPAVFPRTGRPENDDADYDDNYESSSKLGGSRAMSQRSSMDFTAPRAYPAYQIGLDEPDLSTRKRPRMADHELEMQLNQFQTLEAASALQSTLTSPVAPAFQPPLASPVIAASSGYIPCAHCPALLSTAAALARHTTTAHTRPYACTFAFAGCPASFGSKNEWKRHVSSQHLGLSFWRCEIGACGDHAPGSVRAAAAAAAGLPISTQSTSRSGSASSPRRASASSPPSDKLPGNEFNRKDLFTQHLRRMHAPFAVKRQGKSNAEWEARVRHLQSRCLQTRRAAPSRVRCPVVGCVTVFEAAADAAAGAGVGSVWDERMEHVGRHIELDAQNGCVVDELRDHDLIDWAVREDVIIQVDAGSYRLAGQGAAGSGAASGTRSLAGRGGEQGDADADGDSE